MSPLRFQPELDTSDQALADSFIEALLQASDPASATKKHFDKARYVEPTHILSFGKAAIAMTSAAIELLGDRFARATLIAPPALCASAQFKSKFVELFAGDHPLPTPRNIEASNKLIAHARSIPTNHQALVLISGGGSAMLCSPAQGVSLDEIIQTTQSMIKAGKPIQEMNKARAELDTLKAGGLASLLAHVSSTEAYVLSDVIGDDLLTIASGPVATDSIKHTIIANNQTIADAIHAWLAHRKIELALHLPGVIGETALWAGELVDGLLNTSASTPCAITLAGEPTVDARGAAGVGGPMLELALACACKLSKADFAWTLISFASDGIDGPTDAAGAIITRDMLAKHADPKELCAALDHHDALRACEKLGGVIRTGPTGTNINDGAVLIRW